MGADGLAAVVRAYEASAEGRDVLAVVSELRHAGLDVARAAAVADAAAARLRHRRRHGGEAPLLFTRVGLEQASHPEVAAWRARRFRDGDLVVDLCAGLGGDATAIAREVDAVVAVDLAAARLVLLGHNAAVLGVDVLPVQADALRPPLRLDGLVHADPARRVGGRRVRHLADYRPAVPALARVTAAARGSAIVLSPGVDLDDPDLPVDAELEFVQVANDLVEAVLWTGELRAHGVRRSATLLPGGHHLDAPAERPELDVGPVEAYLVELAPAAVRARAHDALGELIGAHRVARRRALLTTKDDPGPSPWWRVWPVEADLPLRPRSIRAWLAEHDEQPVEIATHGLDRDPVHVWRSIGRPPRGVGGRRLHLVRTDDGARCLVTRDLVDAGR